MFDPTSTIVAIASTPGRSLRGILRISGPATFDLLQEHVRLTTSGAVDEARESGNAGSSLHRSTPPGRLTLGEHVLPVISLLMPGSHSYTGEDSAELQLPGNPVLLERVIDVLLSSAKRRGIAARRAEPGEFTARAYLNGRLSLTQAEGVAATIAAQSDAQLRAAHLLTSGSLGNFAHQLANDLAGALALVEAGIDFTDQDDVVAIAPNELHSRLMSLHQTIADHLAHAVGTEQLEAIPWVVLVGEPNAGKSALFNALLGHERAVVSPVEGTTRDVLVEPLSVTLANGGGAAEVMLVDLAGLDDDDGSMNQLMQETAKQAIDRAELTLRCVPMYGSTPELRDGELLVQTKCDLGSGGACHSHARGNPDSILVSAFTGQGLEKLKSLIAKRLANRAVSLAADALALRPRHESALRSALSNLDEAISLIEPQSTNRNLADSELIASSMRAALDDLAALAGDITPDEVLGRVFATFCVGK